MTYTHNTPHSKWEQNNKGQYVRINTGNNIELGIDFRNIIVGNDQLTTVDFSTTSNDLTITRQLTIRDEDVRSLPHQAVAFFEPTGTGVHPVKLEATFNNTGEKYVYRFDVLTER